ncbi:MAG: hypothetical protein ACLQBQ_05490 [Smithella sp.]
MTKQKEKKEQYNKPVSLYPLKPEKALAAFMKVKPEKVMKNKRNKKGGNHEESKKTT